MEECKLLQQIKKDLSKVKDLGLTDKFETLFWASRQFENLYRAVLSKSSLDVGSQVVALELLCLNLHETISYLVTTLTEQPSIAKEVLNNFDAFKEAVKHILVKPDAFLLEVTPNNQVN